MRGDIVTIALQGDFGKPRPALIIQSDIFLHIPSVTVIPFSSELIEAPIFRFTVTPSKENGLKTKSQLMIDKIFTTYREKIGKSFGKITNRELIEIDRLITLFLGLAQEST